MSTSSISPNGLWAVISCKDGTIQFWDLVSRRMIASVVRTDASKRLFSDDGRRVALVYPNGALDVWQWSPGGGEPPSNVPRK